MNFQDDQAIVSNGDRFYSGNLHRLADWMNDKELRSLEETGDRFLMPA